MDISGGVRLWAVCLITVTTSVYGGILSGCSQGDIRCLDGSGCFSSEVVCDSVVNCADGSDEAYCQYISGPPCSGSQLRCMETFQCIDKSTNVCDGENDCPDGLDEQLCFVPDPTTPPGDLTTEVQPDPTTPPGSLTTEVQPNPKTPPGDLTTEVQPDPTTPLRDLTTEVQPDPTTPPGGLTTEVQPGTTTPPGDLTTEVQPDTTTPPRDLTTEVQPDTTTPPRDLTTEVQPDPTTPPRDLTTEVQAGSTTAPGGLTTEVQPDPTTPPVGLTTEVLPDPTTPPGGLTTEVQPDTTTPPDGLTTEVLPDPTTPPRGLTTKVLPGPTSCSQGDITCLDGNGCFSSEVICDSNIDCADGIDEGFCEYITGPPCSGSQFKCPYTPMCIDRSTDVCDGENDCPDGFDEQQCFVPVDDSSDAATSGLGCGGTLSAPPDGSVTSPNYPENYKPDQTCDWLITVPEGSSVRLTFDSFHVENGYDYLYIYDGDSDSATELQKLTGGLSVDPITSTSNKIFVKFVSDESETTQGFQFSYTATPVDLTTEVQVEPTTPPGDLTTEVQVEPTTPPGDLTTEVQVEPTTPPGDLTTEVQAEPSTPPSGLTTEVQPEPTAPSEDTTGMEENGESGASVATTVPGSGFAVIALAHLVLTYCGMLGATSACGVKTVPVATSVLAGTGEFVRESRPSRVSGVFIRSAQAQDAYEQGVSRGVLERSYRTLKMQLSKTLSLVSMAAVMSASFCLIVSVHHEPWGPGDETRGPGNVLDCSNHFVLQRVTDTTHGRYYQDTDLIVSDVTRLRTVPLPKPVGVSQGQPADVTNFQYFWQVSIIGPMTSEQQHAHNRKGLRDRCDVIVRPKRKLYPVSMKGAQCGERKCLS
ncbi:hypothetical protein Bbelb_245210 [Branchiostoma belcheri]|nr:hypothetical protein Bbelb_245210 [Branchiostoma belcheri]